MSSNGPLSGPTSANTSGSIADRGPALIAQNAILTVLTLFIVALRMFCRLKILNGMGPDDWFILAATVVAVNQLVLTVQDVHYGTGKHIWNVPLDNAVPAMKLTWAIQICYPLGLGFIKLSLLSFYIHLCPPRAYKRVLQLFLVLIGVMTISLMIGMVFQCIPLKSIYRPEEYPNAICVHRRALHFTTSALNIATDILILLSPLPLLWQLVLPQRQKLGLTILFSLGGFVCIASIVRLHSIQVLFSGPDQTWNTTTVAIWSCFEINLGIIAASVPGLKPLINKLSPTFFDGTIFSTKSVGSGSGSTRSRSTPFKVIIPDMELGSLRPGDCYGEGNSSFATHHPYSSQEEILHDGIQIHKDVAVTFGRETDSDEGEREPTSEIASKSVPQVPSNILKV